MGSGAAAAAAGAVRAAARFVLDESAKGSDSNGEAKAPAHH